MKRIRSRLVYIFLLTLVMPSFQNCSATHSGQDISSQAMVGLSSGSAIAFDSLKAAIFDMKCLGCHGAGKRTDLSSYASLMAGTSVVPGQPLSSPLYLWTVDGRMPSGAPLSQVEVQAIYDWILQGALMVPPAGSGTSSGGLVVKPLDPTFTNVFNTVFQPFCVQCHRDGMARGGYNLSSYTKIMSNCISPGSVADSECHKVVIGTNPSMPEGGKLTEAQIKLLGDWIAAGALNN